MARVTRRCGSLALAPPASAAALTFCDNALQHPDKNRVNSSRNTLDNRHTCRGASLNLAREAEARGVEEHRILARRSLFATEHQHQDVQ